MFKATLMVQTFIQPITLENFLTLPETKPASEYIDGHLTQKPMPKGQHSILQVELGAMINAALRKTGVATAFTELRCTFGGQSLIPDVSVFQNSRIPRTEQGEIANIFTIAPDWTIEILSPDQRVTKVFKNMTHGLKNGSQMGWILSPEERSMIIGQPGQDLRVIEASSTTLPVPEFASTIQLTLETIFGWLR
jgi:Uma2 family endonuclease